MEKLENALSAFISREAPVADIARILSLFPNKEKVSYQEIAAIVSGGAEDVLLALWEWKLVIPVRSSRCSEWDFRILLAEPGEYYEAPNISRILIRKGMETGRWESAAAVLDLFQEMGEPEWKKMPDLILSIKRDSRHHTINGAGIGAACHRCGLAHKTGAMIAVLKGGCWS